MLKTLLFATLASFALGSAHAATPDTFAKETMAATAPVPLLAGPPSDFDPDPAFGVEGTVLYYLDDGDNLEGHALNVFERPGEVEQ